MNLATAVTLLVLLTITQAASAVRHVTKTNPGPSTITNHGIPNSSDKTDAQ